MRKIGKPEDWLVYAITKRLATESDLLLRTEAMLRQGLRVLQYRDKTSAWYERVALAKKLCRLCRQYGAAFIVNDSLDLALEVEADGLHLGLSDGSLSAARQKLGSDKILGSSAHNKEEALAAYAAGADYLGAGALFSSRTKDDTTALSPAGLQAICQSVPLPVLAIGGIDLDNLHRLRGSGLAGAAFSSALFDAEDSAERYCELRAALRGLGSGNEKNQ